MSFNRPAERWLIEVNAGIDARLGGCDNFRASSLNFHATSESSCRPNFRYRQIQPFNSGWEDNRRALSAALVASISGDSVRRPDHDHWAKGSRCEDSMAHYSRSRSMSVGGKSQKGEIKSARFFSASRARDGRGWSRTSLRRERHCARRRSIRRTYRRRARSRNCRLPTRGRRPG